MRHDYGRCDAILFTLPHGTTLSVYPANPLQAYERQLEKRPVPIQMTTSLLLASSGELLSHAHCAHPPRASLLLFCMQWGLGDVVAQKVAEGRRDLDNRRVALTAIYGMGFMGPVGHFWYLGL